MASVSSALMLRLCTEILHIRAENTSTVIWQWILNCTYKVSQPPFETFRFNCCMAGVSIVVKPRPKKYSSLLHCWFILSLKNLKKITATCRLLFLKQAIVNSVFSFYEPMEKTKH